MVSSTNSSKDRLVVCCVSGKLVLSEMRQAHAHEKPFSSTRVCFEPFVPQHLAATEPVQATKDLSRALGADMASAKTTQVGRLPGPVKMKAPAKATRSSNRKMPSAQEMLRTRRWWRNCEEYLSVCQQPECFVSRGVSELCETYGRLSHGGLGGS
eukprot:symbB.v1.2.026591.t1/scaffold2669.1/size73469/2